MKINLSSIWKLSDCLNKSSYADFKKKKLIGRSLSQIVIGRVIPGFKLLILLSLISVLVSKPAYGAQEFVYADFTVGAIAAYSGKSGHPNDDAVTFAEKRSTRARALEYKPSRSLIR